LNVGLRYEYYSVSHEILNRSAVVDISGCGGFCPKGTSYYEPNTKDFGPRVGLAWTPALFHGRTTIRTGFGIYYGGNQNDDFSDPAESAVRRYSLSSSDFPALAYPLVSTGERFPFGHRLKGTGHHLILFGGTPRLDYTPTPRKYGNPPCQRPLGRFCFNHDPPWISAQRNATRPD
jgi:hypothetical protein